MTGWELLARLLLATAVGAILNIWLIWWAAFLIALVVVFGGWLILGGDVTD